MDDTVSYHFATVKQRRDNRDDLDFQLSFRQQPKQSRMCGVGEKADRRPIDPPPIVQLRVVDLSLPPLEANTYLQNPYYFMYASLMAADLEEEMHLLRDGKTRSTTGSVVSSLYHLKDTDNTDAGFFVFPDLSVRMEGKYRLKLSLFEIIGKEVFHCKSIVSEQFIVYSAKKFPGMEESTFLSRSFADQGLKIRIRKELRQRRKAGKRPESDEESPHMQIRTVDKRHRQHRHLLQTDSIAPTSILAASDNITSTTASSTVVGLHASPSTTTQHMYSMQSPYRDRPSTYFDSNDMELHWAGSRAHHQQQQQRPWPVNQYHINTPVANETKRYSPEVYAHSLHQPNTSIRQYHTPLRPPSNSHSSDSPSTYSHPTSSLHRRQQDSSQTHPSYNIYTQSARPPDLHQQQRQYTDEVVHQSRIKTERYL